jgi:hypothetical protein
VEIRAVRKDVMPKCTVTDVHCFRHGRKSAAADSQQRLGCG